MSKYIEHHASGKTGTFAAKYDQHAERNGQTFTVLGAVDPSTYDAAECGDMFSIRFADGVQIETWPEEVESALDVSIYTDPNEFLMSEYSKYAERIAEGDPMAFDDWLGGSDLPEIVKAREIAKVQERNLLGFKDTLLTEKSGKAQSIAAFKLEKANAETRGLQIQPSVDGPYAWNPITEMVVGRKGSEAYRLATSEAAEPPATRQDDSPSP